MKIKVISLLLVGASVLATACATNDEALPGGYREGWRRAIVLDVGDEQVLAHSKNIECHAQLSAHNRSAKFAITSYSYGGNPNLRAKRLVVISDQGAPKVGDQVFVNILDCESKLRLVGSTNPQH